jgi:hypothetical protein
MITMEISEKIEPVLFCSLNGAIEGWTEPVERDLHLIRRMKDEKDEKKDFQFHKLWFDSGFRPQGIYKF